ncbi:hypothetical protein [Burkholderia gladioli]|uniref:hypothetical protein n=1 Tax=Burkholderia gladioli TaxID=28095 RepID=UPI0020B26040|nr:hypothetical protein [Burkholderia gladioli]
MTDHTTTTALMDDFRGDDAHLVRSIEALIALNDEGALVPHGIGGHARALLSAAAVRLMMPRALLAAPRAGVPLQRTIEEVRADEREHKSFRSWQESFLENEGRPMEPVDAWQIRAMLDAAPAAPVAEAKPAENAELARMTRMFHAACADLGLINKALGLDPDDGGAEPILDAIQKLKDERDQWADAGYAAQAVAADGAALVEPTDAQILEVGYRHFKPGHNTEAEANFVAAVREVLELRATVSPATADATDYAAIERAELGDPDKKTGIYAATADERAAFWAWFDSEWKREERDAGKITCGAWAWKTWKHLRAAQAAAPADAISLLRKAHRTLACAALTQIRDGEAVWTEIGRFLDAAPAEAREQFQARVQPWMMECFGPTIAADRVERNHRFLEEALETVQSLGCTASEAHQLVDYTFGRPVGEPAQEVGGVMVTLAALCLANTLDMHAAGETELARISAPAMVEKIRAKQAAKPKHSPLPQAVAARAPYEWRDTGPLETDEGGAA